MGQDTGIQWCDSTVNPTTGCEGCELWTPRKSYPDDVADRPAKRHCWSGNLHETRLAKSMPDLYAADFAEVRLAPGRMAKAAAWSDLTGTKRPDKPWLDGMPRTIFVDDMSDLFSKAVPFDYIEREVFDVATSIKGRRHIYMLLTKRPHRAVEFAERLAKQGREWPSNVWMGTSVTDQKTADARIPHLLRIPAAVRFLSVEPMLGPVNLMDCRYATPGDSSVHTRALSGTLFGGQRMQLVDWVIYGGESGPDARPCDLAWIRDGVRQCREAGVAPFVKQAGANVIDANDHFGGGPGDWPDDTDHGPSERFQGAPVRVRLRDSHGADPAEWPEDLRVREMPRSSVD